MAQIAAAVGGSLLSGITSGKGAQKAAQIQAQSQAAALAQQQKQFEATQANLQPFIQAGSNALGGQQTLLGLNGANAQQSAISALQQSPQFTSQYNQGLDAILQGAAATGGLRGGNTALAQSNFGAGLLNTIIQQQLSGLGGLSAQGANAASQAGSLGQSNANTTSNILTQGGNLQSLYSLGGSSAQGRTIADLSGILQKALTGNGTINSAGGSGLLSMANGTANNLLNSANSSFAASNPLVPGW